MKIKYLRSATLDKYTKRARFLARTPHEQVFLERVSDAQMRNLGTRSQIPDTVIGRFLAERIEREWANGAPALQDCRPMTMVEFRLRAQGLAFEAQQFGDGRSNGFAPPAGLSRAQEQEVTHLDTVTRRRQMQQVDPPSTAVSEMLMLAFEALPRPIGYAMSGYMPADFIAYIYQDIYAQDVAPQHPLPEFDAEQCARIRDWFDDGQNLAKKDGLANYRARHHVLLRMGLMLDRPLPNVRSLFRGRALRADIIMIGRKLLEVTDAEGYIQGHVRPFELVRADWNALSEYVLRRRSMGQIDWESRFNRLPCPGALLSQGLELDTWQVTLPPGTTVLTAKERAARKQRKNSKQEDSASEA